MAVKSIEQIELKILVRKIKGFRGVISVGKHKGSTIKCTQKHGNITL